MGAKYSKKEKKISSYQRLKMKLEEALNGIEAMIERPHSSEAKSFRANYKIENDLL